MKKLYKGFLRAVGNIPGKIETAKTFTAEWVAIWRKKPLYKHIKWTKEQKAEFKTYWKTAYGKKISNRWHKLYEACNGVHRVDYMPEWMYSVKLEKRWNDPHYSAVFSNKNALGILLDGKVEGVRTPKVILYRSNGCFYTGSRELIAKEKAVEILGSAGEAVIKPVVDSSSGHGVAIVNMADGKNLRNGQTVEELLKIYGDNFCLQERVKMHPQLTALYPGAVNTFRVITYMTEDRIATAPLSMRIGGGGSEVDNIHAGGMSIYVRNDGTLAEQAYRLGYGNRFEKFASHPDTGIVFAQHKFTFVEQMLEKAKKLHPLLLNIGTISWDFTVDEKGEFVVIEMNLKGQSVWFPQMLSGESMYGQDTPAVLKMKKQRKV